MGKFRFSPKMREMYDSWARGHDWSLDERVLILKLLQQRDDQLEDYLRTLQQQVDTVAPPTPTGNTFAGLDDVDVADAEPGDSVQLSEDGITWVTAPPSLEAPTILGGLTGDRAVGLAWSSVLGADSYYVYRDGAFAGSTTGGDTDITITDLVNGRVYMWQVQALDTTRHRTGPLSEAYPLAPSGSGMPAPFNLAAEVGDGFVVLSWESAGGPMTGWHIYRNGVIVHIEPDVSVTTWTDTGVVNGQNYSYQVAGYNGALEGDLSEPVNATPGKWAADGLQWKHYPKWKSGRWYTLRGLRSSGVSGQALANGDKNRQFYVPLTVPEPTPIEAVGFVASNSAVLGTSTTARMIVSIYDDDGYGAPGALREVLGELDFVTGTSTVSGLLCELSVSAILQTGRQHLAGLVYDTSLTNWTGSFAPRVQVAATGALEEAEQGFTSIASSGAGALSWDWTETVGTPGVTPPTPPAFAAPVQSSPVSTRIILFARAA